jgi:hypothetical protein
MSESTVEVFRSQEALRDFDGILYDLRGRERCAYALICPFNVQIGLITVPPHYTFAMKRNRCAISRHKKYFFACTVRGYRERLFETLRRSTDAIMRSAAPVATASGRESRARVQNGVIGAAIAPVASTKTKAAVIPPNMTPSRRVAFDRVWMSSQLTCQLESSAGRVAAAAEHTKNAGKSAQFPPKHDHRVHSVLLGPLRGTRSAATFLGNCAKFHRALARSLSVRSALLRRAVLASQAA